MPGGSSGTRSVGGVGRIRGRGRRCRSRRRGRLRCRCRCRLRCWLRARRITRCGRAGRDGADRRRRRLRGRPESKTRRSVSPSLPEPASGRRPGCPWAPEWEWESRWAWAWAWAWAWLCRSAGVRPLPRPGSTRLPLSVRRPREPSNTAQGEPQWLQVLVAVCADGVRARRDAHRGRATSWPCTFSIPSGRESAGQPAMAPVFHRPLKAATHRAGPGLRLSYPRSLRGARQSCQDGWHRSLRPDHGAKSAQLGPHEMEDLMPKTPTVYDVADLAGVSIATVSGCSESRTRYRRRRRTA